MQIRKSVNEIESNGFGSMLRYDLLNIDETKPHDVATALVNCDGLAIMAIERVRDAITRLTERGVPVNCLLSRANVSAFVGIPNLQAGQLQLDHSGYHHDNRLHCVFSNQKTFNYSQQPSILTTHTELTISSAN